MTHEEQVVRYATGEVACIGDRVDADGCPAIVVKVFSLPDEIAEWGLSGPGVMLDMPGWVFEPCSSIAWDALVFEERGVTPPHQGT